MGVGGIKMTKEEMKKAIANGENVKFDGGEIINGGIVLSEEKKEATPAQVTSSDVTGETEIKPDVNIASIPLPTQTTNVEPKIPEAAANVVPFPNPTPEVSAPSFEIPSVPETQFPSYETPTNSFNNDYPDLGQENNVVYPSFGNNGNYGYANQSTNESTGNLVYPEFGASNNDYGASDGYDSAILNNVKTSLASVESELRRICNRNDELERKNKEAEDKIDELERRLSSASQELSRQKAINKEVQGKILGLFGYNSILGGQSEPQSYGEEDPYSRNRAA